MGIFIEVIEELVGMFIADARLTTVTLALVGGVAALILAWHTDPLLGGGILLVGCIAVLIEAVVREARRRKR